MSDTRRRLLQKLVAEPEGLHWNVENGPKHLKLFINGKIISVFPCSNVHERTQRLKMSK